MSIITFTWEIVLKNVQRILSFKREELDEFATNSYRKALDAQKSGRFNEEIVKITQKSKAGETIIDKDEEPEKVKFDKIPTLKPVFDKDGVVTAANASSINDGAAAVLSHVREESP